MKQILVIEDDQKLNDGICLALKNDSFIFRQCRTLEEARNVFRTHRLSLILLDVNLPDGNGIDFLKEIRTASQVPVILITINNMELDIVTGLEAGANDYITKPFSLMVLRARAAVQLRDKAPSVNRMTSGIFDFDFDRMVFLRDKTPIELSKTEQRLLKKLCENQGITLTRNQLIDSVWQGDSEFVDEHALTVAVKRLRDKLEPNPKEPEYIKTIYGIGYIWAVTAK